MSSLCDISEESPVALAGRILRDNYLYSRRFENGFREIVGRTYAFSEAQWLEVERTVLDSREEER